jgi:hypothetical protein
MQFHKGLKIIFLALLPVAALAQKPAETDITGLWKGFMYNDSSRLNYRYELAISEENGKLYGYSHTYFIVEDKQYHGVKKVKIKRTGDEVITEDIELIANNYPMKPPKGVHMSNTLRFEIKDTVMMLTGAFSTNRTKEFSPVTGYVHVERQSDYRQSALVPHLQELGLTKKLSFTKQTNTSPATETVATLKPAPSVEEEQSIIAAAKKQPIEKIIPPVVKETTAPKPPDPVKAPVVKVPVVVAAADIKKRKVETIQAVYFKSDSLSLTLYDNGEVDGDTVSVVMNGTIVMPRVGLTTNAVRKTIYTKDFGDSIQIIMYAETLGSLPPNTGLLIVYDGKDRYEIRFSGDMQKSSAIVFRRRKS